MGYTKTSTTTHLWECSVEPCNETSKEAKRPLDWQYLESYTKDGEKERRLLCLTHAHKGPWKETDTWS